MKSTGKKQQSMGSPFFIQMAVHDLRGPLTAILNGLDLSLQTEYPLEPEETSRILRLCLDSGNALMRQIDSLLDIAQIENNSLLLHPQQVDPRTLIDNAYRTLANTFIEKNIRLDMRYEEPLPPFQADAEIMRRVFVNMLDNALRFSGRGAAILVEARAEVGGEGRRMLALSVTDNGPGIPEDQRATVFDAYRRLEQTEQAPGARRGMGLGLTFCKLAVEAHQGRITVEDAGGGMSGARFVVRLPIEPSSS
ncbi:MAG: ATP-binding protein [Anaerolineae bacterium]|nr:ATP-binding protein [Anaerolineae bacterium]NUQ06057.1 hypothetical protein [Anaerolineae bacterium]